MDTSSDMTLNGGDLTSEDYAVFIGQIDLRHIWLQSAAVTNHHGPFQPERIAIQIDSAASFEETPTGFLVTHAYEVTAESNEARALEIQVAFALDFESRAPMSEPIFGVFKEINLPVNSWPYLREYVSTTSSRMGWTPITLPALKRGIGGLSEGEDDRSARGQRARKRPSTRSSNRAVQSDMPRQG